MMKLTAPTAAFALTMLASATTAPSVASAMTSAKKADGSFQVAALTQAERRARRAARGGNGGNRAGNGGRKAAVKKPAAAPKRTVTVRKAAPAARRRGRSGPRVVLRGPGISVAIGNRRRGRPLPRVRQRFPRPRPYIYRPRYIPIAVCSPRRAVDKAYDLGLRRPHVVRNNARVVVVQGRRYGGPVRVRFGKGPRCPVLNIRSARNFY